MLQPIGKLSYIALGHYHVHFLVHIRTKDCVRTHVRTYVYVYVRTYIRYIRLRIRTYIRTYDICTYVRTYAYTVATYIRMHMAVGNMPKMRVDPSEMNDNIVLVMTMMQDKPVRPAGPCRVVWDHRMATRSMNQGRTSGRSSSAQLNVLRAYSNIRRGEALE